MKQVTLFEPGFEIVSCGNGTAYTVERLSDGASFHVQGDDATAFNLDWHHAREKGFSFSRYLYNSELDSLFEVTT